MPTLTQNNEYIEEVPGQLYYDTPTGVVLANKGKTLWFPAGDHLTVSSLLERGYKTYKDWSPAFCIGAKRFTSDFGVTPTIAKDRLNRLNREAFPVPRPIWILAHYGQRKSNTQWIVRYLRHKDIADQAIADGLNHLLPFILYTGAPPQELRKMYGKNLWQRLCQNAVSRNKLLINITMSIVNGLFPGYREEVSSRDFLMHLNKMPTTALRRLYGNYMPDEPQFYEWLANDLFHRQCSILEYFRQHMRRVHTIRDTINMCQQLGIRFDPTWTFEQVQTMHDRHVRTIIRQEEKLSDEPFTWLEALTPLNLGDFEIIPLKSPADLAEEGAIQHHCVKSYAPDVARQRYAVFAINGSERLTLGVRRTDNYWSVDQLKGPCNQEPKIDHHQYAQLTVAAIELLKEVCHGHHPR